MEAMACGAALVTYDNGGCREYARDGDTALVARRREIGDLADKLGRLAMDVSLRQRIATAGQALVTTAFDWEVATQRIETLLSEA
jgi:glycosyltransferase involved in cell wall biosynthesis